jgi:hypothetical protein
VKFSFAAFAALLALGACTTMTPNTQTAGAATPAHEGCFRGREIQGYTIVNDHTLDVRVGAGHHYLLSTNWNLHQLNWSQRVELRSSSGWICTGNGLGVELVGGEPRMTYPVSAIARAPEQQPNPAQGAQGS